MGTAKGADKGAKGAKGGAAATDGPVKGALTGGRPDHVRQTERGEPVTMLEAIREALWEEMERDPDVFILGEDIATYGGAFKVTDGFVDHFGEDRVLDTPISEAGFTGAAAGAAHMGLRPVVEMQFMDFVSCAYEPLTNYIATSRWRKAGPLPMVIRGPVGGGVRGGPFHSQNPEMAFFHTPGLKIVYPCTASDAKGLLKAAIRDDDPVLYFEHKKLYRAPFLREVLPKEDHVVPLGKARLHRAGADLTIVTYGMMVHESQKAAEALEAEGVDVEILDLRTLMPLDEAAILDSVKKTGRLLVVHEDTRTGGIAGEIAMRVSERAFEWLDAPMLRVTALDTPVPYSPPLEDYYLPNVEDILVAARYLVEY
ncbi:MAG TPA: alpha-ketoacid dehydrogenase subunit beta [Longimicrobiales bacterium]|nr:alpha-ketoacid dehydrogenase subunit beta [Longimicrobiales bacterium]